MVNKRNLKEWLIWTRAFEVLKNKIENEIGNYNYD